MKKLIGKRILLISPEPWDGLHMSKHHIAQELSRQGNHVFFLDPPVKRNKIQIHKRGDVNIVQYHHWFRGVNTMPRSVNLWYYERLIRSLAVRTGGPFDIIWCFDTSRMQWFPSGQGYKLLYLADYDILYSSKGLIDTADVIFTTSQIVSDHVTPIAKVPVINVGHALDDRWLKDIDTLRSRPIAVPHQVVYAGQLATQYHDWEGFEECATRHPHLDFLFVGPYDDDLAEPAYHKLKKLSNVQFKGLVSKDILIPILRAADLLFFGFRSTIHAKNRANPHKILEYLSTGNVMVGSWTMEYADRPGLFQMAQPGASLADEFDEAVRKFQYLNSDQERTRRIDFAKSRSVVSLLRFVDEHIMT